jgi:hypothetical protein
MLRLVKTFVICACFVLAPALEALGQASAGDKYAYSIQFVSKNKSFRAETGNIGDYPIYTKAGSYDTISAYLQERVSKLLDARGFHPVAPSDPAAFRLTIDLLRAGESSVETNITSDLKMKHPRVGLKVALSITDGAGGLLLRNEYTGNGPYHANWSMRESVATLVTRAADDAVAKIDSDKSVEKALYVPGGTVIAPSSRAAADTPAQVTDASIPPVSASAQSVPRLALLPAGTALTLAFDTDIDSKQATEGDALSFTLTEDLRVGSATVVKAGSKAIGYFYYEKLSRWDYPGVFSKMPDHGRPHIRITSLSMGDTRINIRNDQEKKHGPIVLGAEILGPVEEKNKGWVFEIAKGTQVRAFTAEDVNLLVLP